MSYTTPKFNKGELTKYLTLLNDELNKMEVAGELCVIGGAAMVLGFGSRESTRDIDALLISPTSVRAAIQKVAEREHIPDSWLNDGAKGFASDKTIESREILRLSNLRVVSPQPEYILAMKCIAARVGVDEHDKEDAKYLIQYLELHSSDSVLDIVAKYYVAQRIPAKTIYFVQEICNELFPQATNNS